MKKLQQSSMLVLAIMLMMTMVFTSVGVSTANAAGGAMQTVELDIRNAGFEEDLVGTDIPGWKPWWKPYENAYYEVTTERAYSGTHSVKFTDTSTTQGAILQSDPLPVTPGVEYTASAMMYLEDPTVAASFLLRFYDENDKQVGESLFHYRNPKGEWFKAEVKGVAPANAKYASVFPSLSNFFTAVAYYDDFKVTYQQEGMSLALQAPTYAVQGQSLTVKLAVDQAKDLYAADMILGYDPAALEVSQVELDADFLNGHEGFLTWQDQGGKLRIVASQLQDHSVSGNKAVVKVTFKVLSNSGNTTLAIHSGSTIASSKAATDADLIRLTSDVKARVSIMQDEADLNRDGVVNLADLVLISKNIDRALDSSIQHYDLNGDGKIDITDVGLVALKVMKN
ncbi:cohesin domain-containing protein [Paenibacillus marinisediminis]